jgi:fumarate hydratase subunit beta
MPLPREIRPPLNDALVGSLKSGEEVTITGIIFTGRDAAHKRFIDLINDNKPLPIDLKGQIIYYCGPTPAPPGKPIGSAGPTTSGRMDGYTPVLLEKIGLKGMIGKGNRSGDVVAAMKKYCAVYFSAIGGAGALLSTFIKKSEIVCYDDLGAEAVIKLTVENFPAIVSIDCCGNNLYIDGQKKFKA